MYRTTSVHVVRYDSHANRTHLPNYRDDTDTISHLVIFYQRRNRHEYLIPDSKIHATASRFMRSDHHPFPCFTHLAHQNPSHAEDAPALLESGSDSSPGCKPNVHCGPTPAQEGSQLASIRQHTVCALQHRVTLSSSQVKQLRSRVAARV